MSKRVRKNSNKPNTNNGGNNNGKKNQNQDGKRGNERRGPGYVNESRTGESQNATSNSSSSESEASEAGGGSSTRPRSTTNDPAWYAMSPEMLLTSANLPFSEPLGSPLHLFDRGVNFDGTHTFTPTGQDFAVPGLATFRLKHTIGYSDSLYDAANVAAQGLYTHVRVVNSGRKNYDAPDLMMYALSIGDLYSALEWAKRMYAYAFLYSQRNWYIGKQLIVENGVDPNDLILNLANFATFVNSLINKIAMYALPGDINYFKRRVFTYSTCYIENGDGNVKDQIYQFAPYGFYKFQLDSNNIGSLHMEKWTYTRSNLATTQQLENYLLSILNNIYGDEDFAIMSGDIIKAYGNSLIGMAPMSPDYAIVPVHDPDVLWQMRNADIASQGTASNTYVDDDGTTRSYGDIYQSNTGVLECREIAVTPDIQRAADICRRRMVDSDLPMPDPLTVMESTRLMIALHDTLNYQDGFGVIDTGADFVTEISVVYGVGTNIGISWYSTIFNSKVVPSTYTIATNVVRRFAFKYVPFLLAIDTDNNNTDIVATRMLSNLDNYSVFENKQLTRMHDVALFSLFWVPGIAKLVNFSGNSNS